MPTKLSATRKSRVPAARGKTGIGPAAATDPRRILVPVDFSEPSRQAVAYAARLARAFGGSLRLLHVVETFPIDAFIGSEAVQEMQAAAARGAQARLQELAAALDAEGGGRVEVLVRTGSPHRVIVAAAAEWRANLIVLATRGLTGLRRAYLGSTAERVVRHAPCPVTVVR